MPRGNQPRKPSGRGYGRPRPRHEALYESAEDVCDAFEIEETAPKPERRNHAVRLVDEMEAERFPKGRRPSRAILDAQPTRETHRCAISDAQPPREVHRCAISDAQPPRETHRRATPAASAPPAVADTLPEADYAILSLTPEGEGDTVAVVLARPDGSGGRERLMLHLLVEQYAELNPRVGEITPEAADALMTAGRLCAAVKRGMSLLAYGDRSARSLAYRLSAKGVDRAVAEAAVAYLVAKGYIREEDTARLRAEQDVRKLWGLRRIREDLRANGFTAEAVEEALEALAHVDFEENCATLIRRKCRAAAPLQDRAARQKLIASILRMGYDMDTVRAALHTVEREGK